MSRRDGVSPPPDHLSLGRSANDAFATFRALWRVDDDRFDAAGGDSQVIVERNVGEMTTQRAQVGEIRTATCERVLPRMGRGGSKRARKHCDESGKRDLRGVRHTLVLLQKR